MPQLRAYLDNNATSPVRPEVRQAMLEALSVAGNASSTHKEGREARKLIEVTRDKVARLTGASVKNIIFTSGGTEANNYILSPHFSVEGHRLSRLFVGSTEHVSVLQGNRFPAGAVGVIPVNYHGIVDLMWLEDFLRQNDPILVSLQLANNETGVVQPIAEVARIVHEYGGVLHCDAVQALGKMPLVMEELGVDILTLSAHKHGGPQGVGAVVFSSPRFVVENKLIRGGGQERGNRAGTENVVSIAGFGALLTCIDKHYNQEVEHMQVLKDACEQAVKAVIPDVLILGDTVKRLPNTFSFMIPDRKVETLQIAFDLEGVALSAGAACSSGKVGRSHVITAMGISKDFGEVALRVSTGWKTTEKEVALFASVCDRVLSRPLG